jgi:hypothetical protein
MEDKIGNAPADKTMSRYMIESPAMFPRAQAACSTTSTFGDESNLTKRGTAPLPTTASVWSEFPEAMFVRAQVASYWRL